MVDTREDVLARLLEVVAAIPGMRSAHRNNVDITEDQLPAAIVFDADEETDDAQDTSMRPPNRPTLVRMTPEIVIAEKTAGQVGSELTVLRRELIKRVVFDTELNEQIVKTGRYGNGAIRYLGCQTDVGWMRSMHGALRAQFMFKYVLKPDEL
jgi:hypothetical protein